MVADSPDSPSPVAAPPAATVDAASTGASPPTPPAAPPPGPLQGPDAEAFFAKVRAKVLAHARTPLSTYRVQLNDKFRLEDARRRVNYLARLGVTDLYTSPCMRAMPGSQHGYDVIDHTRLNPNLGTTEEFDALSEELKRRELGWVLDTVPNHMGIERDNALWNDVLENGPASTFARFFDVDWDPVKDELHNKVLLPLLGGQYGEVLERGELQLAYADGAFFVRYFDHVFPLGPRGYAEVLRLRLDELEKDPTFDAQDGVELKSILTAISHLPPERPRLPPDELQTRAREKDVIKRRLAALTQKSAVVLAFVNENVRRLNGTPGDPRSFDPLDRLLQDFCAYRLAHWRVAGEEINYRRFFDINSLAAIRVEDPDVFEEAHALIFRWVGEGKVNGLRIDHPDGLFDPTAYFLRLQERHFLELARIEAEADGVPPEQWPPLAEELRRRWQAEAEEKPDVPLRRALYVVVEKIQGGRERIPDAWAVHGTTGYRFANNTSGLFVAADSERAMTDFYRDFTGETEPFPDLVYEKKRLILSAAMSSEVNVLARELNRISEMNRRTRDFTLNSLHRALAEFIARFPVYRTYVDGWRPELDSRDVRYILRTIARAKESDPTTNASLFDFLRDILLRRYPENLEAREREVMLRFAMKLQQLTGPVMAKGLEDTVFYVYNRLVSLNEVGGEPEHYGAVPSTFHLRNQERAERWPSSMLASSTHDTKRSEDVRARLNVITEIPQVWRRQVRGWAKLNEAWKSGSARNWPTANDEYMFYQTLVGAWPVGLAHQAPEFEDFRNRIRAYMQKAIKEAKVHTSWTNPDPRYDEATTHFVDHAMDPAKNADFLRQAEKLVRTLERPGLLNGLSQLLLKVASPGVADVYQGTELFDFSLVDPDNRRPVDFAHREELLGRLERARAGDRLTLARRLWGAPEDGAIKLYVLTEGLALRRRRPELFRAGTYWAIEPAGAHAENLVAFARHWEGQSLVAVVPRWTAAMLASDGLERGLAGTTVPLPEALVGKPLRNVFTGQTFLGAALDAGELLGAFPVALLEGTPT